MKVGISFLMAASFMAGHLLVCSAQQPKSSVNERRLELGDEMLTCRMSEADYSEAVKKWGEELYHGRCARPRSQGLCAELRTYTDPDDEPGLKAKFLYGLKVQTALREAKAPRCTTVHKQAR